MHSVLRGFFRVTALLTWMMSSGLLASKAQTAKSPSEVFSSSPVLVVGFVGGFVRSDDVRHVEVQMIDGLSGHDSEVTGMVFENRHTDVARKEVLRWLDKDGDGRLSDQERQSARIILLGHSWGGSAAIRLANELNQSNIPVLLTIQLDSINKGGGDDCVIPPNVTQALNFYQTAGLAHGCQMLRPVDPSRTRILGNFRHEYTEQPAGCSSYSWFNRHVLKTHNAMDCDPVVWSQVEKEIWSQVRDVIRVPRPMSVGSANH